MPRTNAGKTEYKGDFEAQWKEYWEEMTRLNQDLRTQQTVTQKTLDLTFDI